MVSERGYILESNEKNTIKFPKAALIFAVLSLGIWFFTTFIWHYFVMPTQLMDIIELAADILVFIFLIVGICMYKIKGHIFTGIVFVLYSFAFGYYLFAYEGLYLSGSVSEAIYSAAQVGVVIFFLMTGIYYALGGKWLGKPFKVVFSILYLVCIIAMAVILVVEYYDFIISDYHENKYTMLTEIGLDFAKNVFLCLSVFLFDPLTFVEQKY